MQVADGEELADPQEEESGAGTQADLEEILGVPQGHHVALLQL